MSLFNQFSYPLITLGVLAVVFIVLRRFVTLRTLLLIEGALILFALGVFFALRTGDGDVAEVRNYETVIGNGRPTFVEFFSNFCTGCLVIRPTVDQIVAEIQPEFNILRVNIHSEVGQAIRDAYQFTYTPEFVLIDAGGAEVWRGHVPPSRATLESLVPG